MEQNSIIAHLKFLNSEYVQKPELSPNFKRQLLYFWYLDICEGGWVLHGKNKYLIFMLATQIT